METRQPASLSELRAHEVRARGALRIERLRMLAQREGHRFVQADLSGRETRKAILTTLGQAFGFPSWYGANLDALYDCLTDLIDSGAPGLVILLDHLSQSALGNDERAALLDVFRDALEPFAQAGIALRVYYT